MNFQIRDKIRYKGGFRTEYEIVRIHSVKIGSSHLFYDIKLTKLDPQRLTAKSKIGTIFKDVNSLRFEKIPYRGHPLTTIFK